MNVHDLPTPALLVDVEGFDHNVATMAAALPGNRLRPHVKAFKSTALAHELAVAGHTAFCCATTREMTGMAAAGLGDDLLLANEVVDQRRLQSMTTGADARITVAVDSEETIEAAARGGVGEVLIDVNVGMFRCGCHPDDAGRLADAARAKGLGVRGVMGYEGHLMTEPALTKEEKVERAMARLVSAHEQVGGDVVSGGGTGTFHVNRWCTEIQAGSYTLMDSQYDAVGLPFRQAVFLWVTVLSVNPKGWAVGDGGLKALGMDHGNPEMPGWEVWFCSDEHVTFGPVDGGALPKVGDRLRLVPSHVDPTVACHDRMHVVRDEEVVDTWEVDLRGW